jgi:acyl carrier protein
MDERQTGSQPVVPPEGPVTAGGIEERVIRIIAQALDTDPAIITPQTSLEGDLGAESLDYLDIAFMLEREFRIQFPRTDFMQRAADHFGEENLVKNGIITDFGLNLLARGMPELGPEKLTSGLSVTEVRKMFIVATFIRVVRRLVEFYESVDKTCPQCGKMMERAAAAPELVCGACGKVVPLRSGDDILLDDVLGLTGTPGNAGLQTERGTTP